jgi:uncharacterized protein (TIGR00255 family)
MAMSMTGFGRGVVEASWGRLIVDIQSVNRRHFEVSVHLPKEMGQYESEVRKWVAEKILRGQVTVRVQWTPSEEALGEFLPSFEFLQGVKVKWETLCQKLHLEKSQIDLRFLIESSPPIQKESPFHDEHGLKECVSKALSAIFSMRQEEGKALIRDIEGRLKVLREKVAQVEVLAPEVTVRMRQKLVEKLAPILAQDAALDERLMREAFLFAEKVDITEELTRLHSHFAQFEQCFHADGMVGKKMEFVIQEMGREVNTIGSKSSEAKISYLVVEMKSEIEKMREQIQNIE